MTKRWSFNICQYDVDQFCKIHGLCNDRCMSNNNEGDKMKVKRHNVDKNVNCEIVFWFLYECAFCGHRWQVKSHSLESGDRNLPCPGKRDGLRCGYNTVVKRVIEENQHILIPYIDKH